MYKQNYETYLWRKSLPVFEREKVANESAQAQLVHAHPSAVIVATMALHRDVIVVVVVVNMILFLVIHGYFGLTKIERVKHANGHFKCFLARRKFDLQQVTRT